MLIDTDLLLLQFGLLFLQNYQAFFELSFRVCCILDFGQCLLNYISCKIFAQLPLSWNLKRVCPCVQHVWPNYSSIYLHTACSSCPLQGECFKKKTKTTKNGCKLSMVLSNTI